MNVIFHLIDGLYSWRCHTRDRMFCNCNCLPPQDDLEIPPEPVFDESFSDSPDASPVVSPDSSPDSSPDASPDVSPDSSHDVSPDASPDSSPDSSHDVSPDASPDASPDSSPDSSPDASLIKSFVETPSIRLRNNGICMKQSMTDDSLLENHFHSATKKRRLSN